MGVWAKMLSKNRYIVLKLFIVNTLFLTVFIGGKSPVKGAEQTQFEKVAENRRVILWVDRSTGLCQITDRVTDTQWSYIPKSLEQQNDLWKTVYRSAFSLRYINGTSIGTAYTGQTDCVKTVKAIPSGVRVAFSFAMPRISFSVEYQLTEDGFRLSIPYLSIKDPDKVLLDLRVLPYLGHLDFGSEGYVVIPDGIGGIIHANRRKSLPYIPSRVYGERFFWTVERDRYNQYGSQQRYLNVYDYNDKNTMSITMPIFGIVRGRSAILGVITKGQFQAQIGPEITPDDRVLSISSQLVFRELTYDIFTRIQSGPIFDQGNRVIEYHILTDEDASYVGIARRYRQEISKRTSAKRINKTGYRLRILFGVEELYKDTRNLIKLTTFHEAEVFLKDLHRQGMRDLDVVLVGWTKKGLLGSNPRHFPADVRFGGTSGLRKLISTGKHLGYSMGVEVNSYYTYKRSIGYRRSDTVKDIQNIPVDIGMGKKEYLQCAKPAWNHFIKKDRKLLQHLGVNGFILWDGLQQGLMSCYDEKHRVGTPQMAAVLKNAARTLHEEDTIPIGVIGSMDYLMPYTDGFFDAPSTASNVCDSSVPLLPLVYHGLIGYSFEPTNLRRDQRYEFLKMVEYGGIPNMLLTARTVERLKDAAQNPVFSGRYQDWHSVLIKESLEYNRFKSFGKQAMIGHRQLAQGVYQSVYSDGSSTVVNYNRSPYQVGTLKVKPLNYVTVR